MLGRHHIAFGRGPHEDSGACEMLLHLNRPAEALKEFEATLKKEPNRLVTDWG